MALRVAFNGSTSLKSAISKKTNSSAKNRFNFKFIPYHEYGSSAIKRKSRILNNIDDEQHLF